MKIKAIVHEAEEGGFWAEVPALPGCATEGETYEEVLKNLEEAIEGCLSAELPSAKSDPKQRVVEIVL
jgi:predicted RNase H-like HicB family nuclease